MRFDLTAEELATQGIVNLDGVWWYDAPIPPKQHRCAAQTTGRGLQRCACGATRFLDEAHIPDAWIGKNERLIAAEKKSPSVRKWWRRFL